MYMLRLEKTLTFVVLSLPFLFAQSHEETNKIKLARLGNILIKSYLRLSQ